MVQTKPCCETSEAVLIAMLQRDLEHKNQQLEVKDMQICELNARLAESNADRTGCAGTSCRNDTAAVSYWRGWRGATGWGYPRGTKAGLLE